MTDREPPDPPTRADLARARLARRAARVVVADAERRFGEAMEAAFRSELKGCVRSASPFLVRLAAQHGLTMDGVAARLVRSYGWPKRPEPAQDLHDRHPRHRPFRRAERKSVSARLEGLERPPTGYFPVDLGGWAEVRLIGHSLEALLTIGSLTFRTRFGDLMIHVRGGLPASLAACAVGRPLDDFVMHPATGGMGWRVDVVDGAPTVTTLICRTGTIPCTLR